MFSDWPVVNIQEEVTGKFLNSSTKQLNTINTWSGSASLVYYLSSEDRENITTSILDHQAFQNSMSKHIRIAELIII